MSYPFEVVIGADWFVRNRRFFSIGSGGTLESSGGLDIEGGWTRLAYMCSEAWSSETLLATFLPVLY